MMSDIVPYALLNVLNSEVTRRRNFDSQHGLGDDFDQPEVLNQILINQQQIMLLLLEAAKIDTADLRNKISQVHFVADEDRWIFGH